MVASELTSAPPQQVSGCASDDSIFPCATPHLAHMRTAHCDGEMGTAAHPGIGGVDDGEVEVLVVLEERDGDGP